MTFNGKNILITQNSLRKINGSEVVTYELAYYMKHMGARVTIFTHFADLPMKKYFEDLDIGIVTDENDLGENIYDLIWIHHQVIPVKILVGALKARTEFIFFHMSGSLPLERQYNYKLEESISSLSLFVSEEARDLLLPTYENTSLLKTDIFPNPAPSSYSSLPQRNFKSLKRILVVSNHPPQEILDLKNILIKSNIKVSYMGENSSKPAVFSASKLSDYDLIITIGKTVQYCLCAGVPVYVYDHFGGPGYLTEKNIVKASYHNFSGRGFIAQSSDSIAHSITEDFNKSVLYQTKNRESYIKKYSLDILLPTLISRIDDSNKTLPANYISYLETSQQLIRQYIILYQKNDLEILRQQDIIKSQQNENTALISQNKLINQEAIRYKAQYEHAVKDLHNYANRKMVKITNKLDLILRRLLNRN